MEQTIVLISSGQPSANPRLVKEALALDEAGYKVTVIYIPLSPWADAFDKKLFQEHAQIEWIRTGYHPYKQPIWYKWARVRRKVLASLYAKIGDVFHMADYSTILFGQELLNEASKHKADLYIAHNLGALPAAVKAAKKYQAKVAFDAEDYHRGEFAPLCKEQEVTKCLEEKYFPSLNYLSTASPFIEKAYKKAFPALNTIVLNNCFPLKSLSALPVRRTSLPLKLFWFSQTLGKNRGIETIIQAMGQLSDHTASLTLLGNATPELKSYFKEIAIGASVAKEQVQFLPPVEEEQLFKIAATHDIGLGSEIPYCENRALCLTNKIFTYLLAGNALVLSDTQAQEKFLKDYPGIGALYTHNQPKSLAKVLQAYVDAPALLKQHQQNARALAERELNWETESKKFLAIVQAVLPS